ncbi:MAG: glyoxalase/bleomycin resistance/extradiol dioxygenase family protein [Saprospiraceae bacterium]
MKRTMKLNLLVIRTQNIELLKHQYELLGFKFNCHKHGNGPFHYASEMDGFVFEIYPLTKSMGKADSSIRLGFDIKELALRMQALKNSSWKIISDISMTEWGPKAILQDLDGRKVELKNIS